MPFTPFHFGPGAALKAVVPARFSFTIFCYSRVVTDLESGFYLVRGEYPVHRFFHTYIGATLVGIFCALSGRPVCQFALGIWRTWIEEPDGISPRRSVEISRRVALLSALAGTYSHVFLDSIMHRDVTPFSPFTSANPMLHLVSTEALHEFCLAWGIVGALILLLRAARSGPQDE